ncbi:MAG: M23 family metallopeptidase [candidate division WOR-3 bacterium]|uniref:M23 family metallopeptidase n=1 Tax=candidate division WOR-3 bacterium TaxID=2052148 RepID=A0A7C3EV07_UNCW3|nr:M23 family metallopeptidase [candidate division WOR-3 bacterium]
MESFEQVPKSNSSRRVVIFVLVGSVVLFSAIIAGLKLQNWKRHHGPQTVCAPLIPSPESTYYGGDRLQNGEVLAGLLSRWCINTERINAIYNALEKADFNFRRMTPGDSVTLIYQGLNFRGIDYHSSPVVSYQVRFDSNGTAAAVRVTRPVDTVKCVIRGTIENSLWNSLLKLGGTPELVVEFAEILRYDIDFFTECNNGDTFELLADRLEVDGRFYRFGRVYAVHYRSRTDNVYGFYYQDPTGRWDYYNEKGQSLRKTVLRSPLSFARVSSYFGMRFHPILRVVRPHQGVDYVAPRGTPVSAIADGVVTMARWNGGYGKMVEVRHSGGLVSRYGHLSGYGPGVKVGRSIRQGATVGYVGATGLATGPHLHFEIRQNGKPVNPLKVIPPRAEPVPARYLADFQAVRDRYLAIMRTAGQFSADTSASLIQGQPGF